MAAIPSAELSKLRQQTAKDIPVQWLKPHINAALQALEDWFDDAATKTEISNRINTATQAITPSLTFTNTQKKKIGKYWLKNKFGRE